MSRNSGSSSPLVEEYTSSVLLTPLVVSNSSSDTIDAVISFGDLQVSSASRVSTGEVKINDNDGAGASSSLPNSTKSAAPMSGEIPSPTGGIHTFRTTDHLRHRHTHNAGTHQRIQLEQQYYTPPPPKKDYDLSGLRATHSLDDADIAAGARCFSTRRAESDTAEIGPHRHRFSSVRDTFSTPALTLSSTSINHSSSHTMQQQFYTYVSNDLSSNPFNDNVSNLLSPPSLQKIDRLQGVGGSETDFLLLSSSASIKEDQPSASSSISEGDGAKNQLNNNTSGNSPRRTSRRTRGTSGGSFREENVRQFFGTGMAKSESFPPLADIGKNGVQMTHQRGTVSRPNLDGSLAKMQSTPTLNTKNRFVVLGWDMSAYSRRSQFLISAGGTFTFSLLYGYLQELISVELCHRKLGLFLAASQFLGYTILSYFFRNLDSSGVDGQSSNIANVSTGSSLSSGTNSTRFRGLRIPWKLRGGGIAGQGLSEPIGCNKQIVPMELYLGLSILRAIDLGMTNLAMQYVNYPAKTLMKSTRVVFTMIFGVLVTKKRYGVADFAIVGLMVAGLGMFMHADASSSAVFQPLGIVMLTISLLCDGAISNISESIMNRYEVGQDEFIFRLYSCALCFVCVAAVAKGDLRDGMVYLTFPGTLKEIEEDLEPTWSVSGKLLTMILFSTTGFLGSSCSAAITKSFGALTMSITSTARKATTIFLSFALFPNECTPEHICGIFFFITSLVAKSLRASRHSHSHHQHQHHHGERVFEPSQAGFQRIVVDQSKSPKATSLRRKVLGDDAV